MYVLINFYQVSLETIVWNKQKREYQKPKKIILRTYKNRAKAEQFINNKAKEHFANDDVRDCSFVKDWSLQLSTDKMIYKYHLVMVHKCQETE